VSAVPSDRRATGLERLNGLPTARAEAELLACCGARRWAALVAATRPQPTMEALLAAAEEAWWALDEADWREAFAAHPRIGGPDLDDASARREQQGVAVASEETLAALALGNRRYEQRFGRVFLVFASGRTADELLALLERRLANDPATELRVAAGEQARITRLRLERLLLA
jgi:OHCU decarboxylase